eukprot:2925681-Pleurochrysis_carterae.AAC.2
MLPFRFESARMHAHRAEQPHTGCARAQLTSSSACLRLHTGINASTCERGRLCVNSLRRPPSPPDAAPVYS